jgi:hypothetical protein
MMIILPRQARDKHRKKLIKRVAFSCSIECNASATCKTAWVCPHCVPSDDSAAANVQQQQQVEVEVVVKEEDPAWVGSHMQDDNWLYMSAVCYIFGKNIHAHTGKPVGLVNTNWVSPSEHYYDAF